MRAAYCAAKCGLAGYADALRGELSPQGVAVHVIYPGSIATNVSRNALTGDGSPRGRSDRAIDEGIDAHQAACRSEEHTSELQSLMRISYAVFCLKKKPQTPHNPARYYSTNLLTCSISQQQHTHRTQPCTSNYT